MLKRVVVFFMVIGCFIQLSTETNSYAKEVDDSNVVVEQVFEDGSYIESVIVRDEQAEYARSSTISGKKEYSYKNSSGKIIWTAVLHGSFTYNGSSAKCTTASVKISKINENWKATEKKASISGNSALGKVTTKRYVSGVAVQVVNRTLKLTCTASGKLK